jgi:S-adenosylmethionine-dependent methyltransferase
MSSEATCEYYASFGEREWSRLENPDDGAVEFALTCHVLNKYLPSNLRILDIGCGPGRYSIWLAQQRHQIVLADLSTELLRIAQEKITEADVNEQIEEIVEADACDLLHWSDNYFDAVLCLGPFYHLPNVEDRRKATDEIVRVLRPGGLAFIALMPRMIFLRRTLAIADERHRLRQADFVDRVLNEGVFENDIPGRFTNGYGVKPDEVAPFFEEYGFRTLGLLAAESITVGIQRSLVELAENDPVTYQAALEVIVEAASDPSILGMAAHLLYIGRNGLP